MGDAEAARRFTDLYDAYYPRVFAYAVSRVGRQAAEDVASETFAVAWRRLGDIPGAELPWLFGVARNIVRDEFRADTRRTAMAAQMRSWAETQADADDVADHVVARVAVLRALATLSEHDREVVTLVAWHGLSSAEAARVMACSRATFFVRLHRARRRLERAVAGEEDGSDAVRRTAVRLVPERESVR